MLGRFFHVFAGLLQLFEVFVDVLDGRVSLEIVLVFFSRDHVPRAFFRMDEVLDTLLLPLHCHIFAQVTAV